jgi:hypothetical protein
MACCQERNPSLEERCTEMYVKVWKNVTGSRAGTVAGVSCTKEELIDDLGRQLVKDQPDFIIKVDLDTLKATKHDWKEFL